MKFKFERDMLDAGAAIPKCYGYAYSEVDRNKQIFYIIPFNWAVILWRKVYKFLRFGNYENDQYLIKSIQSYLLNHAPTDCGDCGFCNKQAYYEGYQHAVRSLKHL